MFQIRQLITTSVTLHCIVGFVDPVSHLHTALKEVSSNFLIVINNKHGAT